MMYDIYLMVYKPETEKLPFYIQKSIFSYV